MTAEHEGCPDCLYWQQRIAELCRERDEAVARYDDFRAAYTSEREEIALDEAKAAETAARELWTALELAWHAMDTGAIAPDDTGAEKVIARHRAAYGKAGT